MRLALMLGMALVACGAPDEQPSACASHRCDTVPMAFEATAPVVEKVVADLREATGADVITDPFGVPVLFMPVVINPVTQKAVCGMTVTARDNGALLYREIHIATEPPAGCGSLWYTIAHEVIHVLAPDAEHTAEGVFAATAHPSRRFDKAAIDVVCSRVACSKDRASVTLSR